MMEFDSAQIGAWDTLIRRGELAVAGRAAAARPLRIATLGWARLSQQAREGSGLNLSASEFAAAMVARGHRVCYLRSGMEYSLRSGMHILMREVWRGVGCFSLINSPNLAPGNFNFRNVQAQSASPAQAALVVGWCKAVRADIVHVQSLEGFGLDTVGAIKAAGIAVVMTPHNYYYLCPQVDLLAKERAVCEGHDGGLRCEGCLSHAPDAQRELEWRRRYQSAERVAGPHALAELKFRGREIGARIAAFVAGEPEPPVMGEGADMPRPGALPIRPPDAVQRVIAAEGKLAACNDYGRRRIAGVAAMNSADAVLCPSRVLMRIHEAFGVEGSKLRHVPLGQPHFDALRCESEASPFYEEPMWTPESPRPLRLAYFGNCFPNKGLATLCAAIERLDDVTQGRVHFVIRAAGEDRPFRAWMAGRRNVSFLGSYDIEQLLSSPGEYDVCVFPNMGLENSPFVVLEALHAGRAVIASDLGGPTDFVKHGENGWLFRAGDADSLAEAIRGLVRGERRVPSASEVHRKSSLRSFGEFVDEMAGVFESVKG